jgi:hypothetical protein
MEERRSPMSFFSRSVRVSIPDRRSLPALLSAPNRFSSSPMAFSVGFSQLRPRSKFSMRAAATFSSNRDRRDQLAFIVGDGFTPFEF